VFEASGIERMSFSTKKFRVAKRERERERVIGGEGIYIELSKKTSRWAIF
jgi:hypothetical protein